LLHLIMYFSFLLQEENGISSNTDYGPLRQLPLP
jgi:hypothetical protein